MTETLHRLVRFLPAYDRRDPDPAKDGGIHGVTIQFIVKGSRGATSFTVYTNWQLPEVGWEGGLRPMPACLTCHGPVPPGEEAESCDILDGGACRASGSTLRADGVWKRLLRDGDAGVWEALESEYRCILEYGSHRPECLCAEVTS